MDVSHILQILKNVQKDLFINANLLYNNKFKNKSLDQLDNNDINEYNILREKLLEYTKKFLTTDKICN